MKGLQLFFNFVVFISPKISYYLSFVGTCIQHRRVREQNSATSTPTVLDRTKSLQPSKHTKFSFVLNANDVWL